MEDEESKSPSIVFGQVRDRSPSFSLEDSKPKHSKMDSNNLNVSPVKQTHNLHNKHDTKSSSYGNLSWPSLWKNGPRRSAFQLYKPSRTVSCGTAESSPNASNKEDSLKKNLDIRPASTTFMTNIQRGNFQTQTTPESQMSWFTLVGRGDVTIQQLQEMVAQGKNLDCVDEEGLSGLMWAAYYGQMYTIQILFEVGKLKVDREGMWGETALMLAATEGHLDIVRLLIHAGADVNHEDHSHNTALMCAVKNDHPHSVNELLVNGADIWVENSEELTAYDMAVNHRSLRSKAVLEKYISTLVKEECQKRMASSGVLSQDNKYFTCENSVDLSVDNIVNFPCETLVNFL